MKCEELKKESNNNNNKCPNEIECLGYKEWTDYGYEYGCGYLDFDKSCEECACCGGRYDPRTNKLYESEKTK